MEEAGWAWRGWQSWAVGDGPERPRPTRPRAVNGEGIGLLPTRRRRRRWEAGRRRQGRGPARPGTGGEAWNGRIEPPGAGSGWWRGGATPAASGGGGGFLHRGEKGRSGEGERWEGEGDGEAATWRGHRRSSGRGAALAVPERRRGRLSAAGLERCSSREARRSAGSDPGPDGLARAARGLGRMGALEGGRGDVAAPGWLGARRRRRQVAELERVARKWRWEAAEIPRRRGIAAAGLGKGVGVTPRDRCFRRLPAIPSFVV